MLIELIHFRNYLFKKTSYLNVTCECAFHDSVDIHFFAIPWTVAFLCLWIIPATILEWVTPFPPPGDLPAPEY